MADNTVRLAAIWAGWAPVIYANNGFKALRCGRRRAKTFKLELVLIDARCMRDVRVRQGASAGRRSTWYRFCRAAAKDSYDAASNNRLVERRRRHRLPKDDQVGERPAREDGRARAELAVAFLPAQHTHFGRASAGRRELQVHPGRVSGRGRVQRGQVRVVRCELGAGHLQPGRRAREHDAREHADGEQAHCRRVRAPTSRRTIR